MFFSFGTLSSSSQFQFFILSLFLFFCNMNAETFLDRKRGRQRCLYMKIEFWLVVCCISKVWPKFRSGFLSLSRHLPACGDAAKLKEIWFQQIKFQFLNKYIHVCYAWQIIETNLLVFVYFTVLLHLQKLLIDEQLNEQEKEN